MLFAVWCNSARQQKQAVADIEFVHGRVMYDFNQTARHSFSTEQTSCLPSWLVRTFGVDSFHTVFCVDINTPDATDATLQRVQSLKGLRHLYINNSNITSDGLSRLKKLPHLQKVVIYSDVIDDSGIVHLAHLDALEELQIHFANVSDGGISQLKNLSKLKRLWLSETEVTQDGIEELSRALHNCEIIFEPRNP
jgi:hypothetical protein